MGKTVLDVGCGAGRFAEIALSAGARVVAVDYSTAVSACRANLGQHRNLDVIQADMYALPLSPEQFDFVYCFGVLQHTPTWMQPSVPCPVSSGVAASSRWTCIRACSVTSSGRSTGCGQSRAGWIPRGSSGGSSARFLRWARSLYIELE